MNSKIGEFVDRSKYIDKAKIDVFLSLPLGSESEVNQILAELIQSFLDHYRPMFNNLLELFKTSELGSLTSEMHGLKSAAGNLGGMSLSRICDQIEQLCLDEPDPMLGEKLRSYKAKFQEEFIGLEKEMNELLRIL